MFADAFSSAISTKAVRRQQEEEAHKMYVLLGLRCKLYVRSRIPVKQTVMRSSEMTESQK